MSSKQRSREAPADEHSSLQMTPMIDIVFLLLVFFLLTFKITQQEGDLAIQLPAARQPTHNRTSLPPLFVRLSAAENGDLASIRLGEQALRNLGDLHHRVRNLVLAEAAAPMESPWTVVLECDPRLHYEHVIAALSAVTAYKHDGQIMPLIEKVELARPLAGPLQQD